MTVLRSYVGGAWTEPADEGRPVLDAVTGEEVARVSAAGIDLAAALDYGRSSGGPALRELTFHQRAALLKSLGQLLREHRHRPGLDDPGLLRGDALDVATQVVDVVYGDRRDSGHGRIGDVGGVPTAP